MSEAPVLLIEDREAVRILRLNRPAKLNALDSDLTRALRDELKSAADTESVRAIVLTAEGRAFCAGADVAEMKEQKNATPEQAKLRSETNFEMYSLACRHNKPIVAAIHGATIGGGAGLALCCDMVVAASNVKMSFPELKHGIIPGLIMPILQRHFGRKLGFELISTGNTLTGEDLLRLGVANRLLEPEKIFDEALAIARTWADAPPHAMVAAKALYYEVADQTFADALANARHANAQLRKG